MKAFLDFSSASTRTYASKRFRRRRSWLLPMLLPIFLISACRQAAPDIDTAAKEITSAGGTLSLPGGVTATFESGFLAQTAAVTLSLSDHPVPYPPEVAGAYAGGEAVAKGATITLPAAALAVPEGSLEQPTLTLRVPATVPLLKDNERLLAEVHLFLADGQHLFFFEPYARVEGEHGQNFEGTDTVTLHSGQLRADGAVLEENVRIVVRPVRLSDTKLGPLALPSGFVLEDVATGLNNGVAFDFAADNRIFVATKNGTVRVVQDGRVQTRPFVDLTDQVNNFHDRGMLGIAVHPLFPQQPYVYVLYTYDPPEVQGQSGLGGPDNGGARVARLVRLTADAAQSYNVAVPGSDVVLLGKNSTYANIGAPTERNSATSSCGPLGAYVQDCLPADEWSHTIGSLRFGTDGSLFVSNGDGANYGLVEEYVTRALDLDSLAGKVLRINPLTGQGYSDNPFYDGNADSNRSKIYSYGLRNPFRFTVNRQTNTPVIGDVGWNTWEEVNSGRGANFGWPCYEGGNGTSLQQGGYRSLSQCESLYANPNVTAALYAYSHGGGGSSVQVGDFYTGTRYPEAYRGGLFISDFDQGTIKFLGMNANGTVASVNDFATDVQGITQISAGPQGDLYIMNIYAEVIWRLRYTAPGTTPLVASASADPLQVSEPSPITFSSAGSSGSGALQYAWDFGDGTTSAEANPSHTFAEAGVYRVSLRVTDESGESATDTVTVRVNNTQPTATILSPAPGTRYNVGDPMPFSGRGNDPEQGELPESALTWTVRMHHNAHVHLDGLPPTTGSSGSFVTEDHGDNTYIELCLTAKDAFDETGTSCVALYPNTVAYTLDTVPTGLQLPWEGTLRTTPFTVTTNVNARQQLIAPAQQGEHTFVSWSDGGAREHDIRIGNVPARLVATYQTERVKQDQTITFTSAAPTAALVGGGYTVSATATSGLAVSFASNTPAVCAVTDRAVNFVATGTCTVRASQAGDANYSPAPTVDQTFAVGAAAKRDQTITFSSAAPSGATVGGGYTVAATASSGLPVSFTSATPAVCTLLERSVSFVGAGTCTVRASQAGDAAYNAAPSVSQTFSVAAATPAKQNQRVRFTSSAPNPARAGASYTVRATATSGLPVSFSSATTRVCRVSGSTVRFVAAGSCTVRASQGGNASYNAAPTVSQTFRINRRN